MSPFWNRKGDKEKPSVQQGNVRKRAAGWCARGFAWAWHPAGKVEPPSARRYPVGEASCGVVPPGRRGAAKRRPDQESGMASASDPPSPTPDAIAAHYASGYEAGRLDQGAGRLDRERSRELLARFLPPLPATVLDVGGGPGGHACWLAARGYRVHLIDITPVHVELARQASDRQPHAPLAGAAVGDARALAWA